MSSLRTILDMTDGKLTRSRVKEKDGEGAYRALKRALCQGDITNLRVAERAARLHARGVTDEADILVIVNATRAARHSAAKKRTVPEAGAREKPRPLGQGATKPPSPAIGGRPHVRRRNRRRG
jgi:hypothetical protein